MKKKRYEIELSESAEKDFESSYKYYEAESPKVAEKFLKTVDKQIERISKNPDSYPVVHKDIRKSVIKRFPFLIYFQIKLAIIQIIGIFHTSRNPEIWKKRIEPEQ